MGLASSQARMLLLTARKSDLEYRAQMISQRKINLAMQTQELATQYSQSMSNRVMKFNYANVDGVAQYEKLSYAGITANNADYVGDYLVKTATGKYAVTDEIDALKVAEKVYNASGTREVDLSSMTAEEKNQLLTDFQKEYGQFAVISALDNADYFQDALRNGGLYLYKNEQTTGTDEEGNTINITTGYNSVSWSSCGCIADSLDTEDDAQAEAEYESKTLVLANQDKMLDLELNQIETQHKAIETEYDSVKKVIEKNIEVSYKIFA